MSSLLTFIGRWHPVVVHLPIGFILGALLLQVMAGRRGFGALRPAVSVLLLAGVVFAAVSCMTGYLLSLSGDYDASLVSWHMWMGICLCLLSFVLWVRTRGEGRLRFAMVDRVMSVVVLLMVIVTGHLGGSLTHGSDYLSLGGGAVVAEVDSPIVNVQEARAYAEVVRPLLRDNCYGCHGANRQKGGLRLDSFSLMMKGGKDGVVILPGRGDASELIKRLLLPGEDEHHMPPKEKRPLNAREISLLHWWIDQGADPSRRVAELKQPDSMRSALLAVQERSRRGDVARVLGDVPEEEVGAADESVVGALQAKGVLVIEVARGRHWLEAEVPGDAVRVGRMDSVVRLLAGVRKQLVSLKMKSTGIGDIAMAEIGQCVQLRMLDVSGTRIADAGVSSLRGLKELRVLNLVGTGVSAAGMQGLRGLPKLRAVYLYRTKVRSGDWTELKRVFPKVKLDTGGYSMPVLESDTAVVRQKKGI